MPSAVYAWSNISVLLKNVLEQSCAICFISITPVIRPSVICPFVCPAGQTLLITTHHMLSFGLLQQVTISWHTLLYQIYSVFNTCWRVYQHNCMHINSKSCDVETCCSSSNQPIKRWHCHNFVAVSANQTLALSQVWKHSFLTVQDLQVSFSNTCYVVVTL